MPLGKGVIKSNMYLVPTLKGALDPKKGIIFRTYYIRPEKLRQMMKQAQQLPTKNYILHIPNYTELENAIKTGTIAGLYQTIRQQPGGEAVWNNIVSRNSVFSKHANVQHHQQKFLQNIYAYVLTGDVLSASQIAKNASKAIVSQELSVQQKVKVNTAPAKLKRKERRQPIRERYRLKRIERRILEQTLLDIFKTAPQQIKPKEETLTEKDWGMTVSYITKLYKKPIPQDMGTKLSAFLNYLNINPVKAKAIVSQLISSTSLNDKYHLSGNLILKNYIYFTDPEFWTQVLIKNITSIFENPEFYSSDNLLYYNLMLNRLNKKQSLTLLRTYPNKAMKVIAGESIENVLKTENLTQTEKAYFIASLPTSEAERNLDLIISYIDSIEDEDIQNMTLSALLVNVNNTKAWKAITAFDSDVQNINSYFDDLHSRKVNWRVLILQIIFSKLLKFHFVPYEEIVKEAKDPFTFALSTKLVRPFYQNLESSLQQNLKIRRSQVEHTLDEQVEVYFPFEMVASPDNQNFIHFRPLETFNLGSTENKNALKGWVNRKHIVSISDEVKTVIIYDPITNVKFPNENIQ